MSAFIVGGLVPFTTIDMPGKNAAVIFCQGCSWRCRYCQNAHLQKSYTNSPINWDTILRWLELRKGLLDAVVFSGGEPTLQRLLQKAMNDVRTMGFEIGLHTGGHSPKTLSTLLPLLDWIGLDVKSPRLAYEQITGVTDSGKNVWESLDIVLRSKVSYEIRTTYHPELLGEFDMTTLAVELAHAGVKNWVIQNFRPKGCVDHALLASKHTNLNGAFLEHIGKIFLQHNSKCDLSNIRTGVNKEGKTNHRKFLLR